MQIRAISYSTGTPITIGADDGLIRSIEPDAATKDAAAADLPYVAPGLVDLQINGCAGHDFNAAVPTAEIAASAVRAAWRDGVTSVYPTVITNSDPALRASLSAIASACDADALVSACVAGVHLEGPFISPEDGARGAHHRDYVRAPDWDLFRRWQDAANGRIAILTLSPEWPGSGRFIERCAEAGVIVSIGHTAATPDQIADAVRAGARLSTHLGNGAHLMLPRHPNYLWEQLAQDDLWTCVIADGFHLPDQVLKVILRVKGERAIVVSDAVSLAGLPPGPYQTAVGGEVVLTPEGRLHLADNPKLLAGSAQMLPHHIGHLLARGLADLRQSWDMASIHPSRLMNLPQAAGLTVGAPADWVLFRVSGPKVRIEQVYKSGRRVDAA